MESATEEPPIELTGEALAYWNRHASRLRASGTLTDSDLDAFCILCDLWEKFTELRELKTGADNFREMIQLSNVQKQYHAYAKQFGLLPRERKTAKMETEPPKAKDKFGL